MGHLSVLHPVIHRHHISMLNRLPLLFLSESWVTVCCFVFPIGAYCIFSVCPLSRTSAVGHIMMLSCVTWGNYSLTVRVNSRDIHVPLCPSSWDQTHSTCFNSLDFHSWQPEGTLSGLIWRGGEGKVHLTCESTDRRACASMQHTDT